MSQTSESKVAGMWRNNLAWPLDGKLKFVITETGEMSIARHIYSNEWEGMRGNKFIIDKWLDESPEGLASVESFYREKFKKELLDKYPDLTLEL